MGEAGKPIQKRTWANKLELRRNLFSLRLKNGESVQEHVKAMTSIFEDLSVIGDPISEEGRVVHLLASLPDSYSILVTAFEVNVEVPKLLLSGCYMKNEQMLMQGAGEQ